MSKADNMLAILWILRSGRRVTAKQLAETLEINIRTVYRYIDSLCASGVPIISDAGHNGGYSLLRQFTDAPLLFDMDEQKALMHAAIFAKEAGYPFSDILSQALGKLQTFTNDEQKAMVERHMDGLEVIHPPSDATSSKFLGEIEIAVAERQSITIHYQKGNDPIPEPRGIDPYGLVYWKHSWYLIGHCHKREEVRSFRVDRIRGLERQSGNFARPEGFSAKSFFMQSLLPGTDQTDQGQKLVTIRIGGYETALNDLCKHWLLGHGLIERTATGASFALDESTMLHFVPYWLLSYGRAIRVLEPRLLIDRMAQVSFELAEHYKPIHH